MAKKEEKQKNPNPKIKKRKISIKKPVDGLLRSIPIIGGFLANIYQASQLLWLIVTIAPCCCILIMCIGVYQTFASEDKGELLRGGFAVAECTGLNLDKNALLKCAVETQAEKYGSGQAIGEQ